MSLEQYKQSANELQLRANNMVVKHQAEYDVAAGFIKTTKVLKEKIKNFFEPTIESFKKAKAQAEKGRKEEVERMNLFLKPVEDAMKTVVDKCKAFEDEQIRKAEEEVRKKEAEAKRLADEEQARLLKEAEEAEKEGNETKAQEVFAKAEEVKAESVEKVKPEIVKTSGLGITRRWKWKVVEENKIPKKYWVLNEVMINKEVVSNKENTNIPGIEAYKE